MSSSARQFTDYLKGPYQNALAVAPNDTTNLQDGNGNPVTASELFLGSSGTVKVRTSGGQDVTFTVAAAGCLTQGQGIQIIRVWSTGTSCTNIVAMW